MAKPTKQHRCWGTKRLMPHDLVVAAIYSGSGPRDDGRKYRERLWNRAVAQGREPRNVAWRKLKLAELLPACHELRKQRKTMLRRPVVIHGRIVVRRAQPDADFV